MPASQLSDGRARLKAEGFPVAPLIEAVMEIQLEGGLNADESDAVAAALGRFYLNRIETKQTEFLYELETAELDVREPRAIYRLEGEDDTEVTTIRPNGISVSQLAPYRSWNLLFDRLKRDLTVADEVLGVRPAARVGVRFINRVDVPFDDNGIARYEDYFESYIRLPDTVPEVTDFYFKVNLPVPEIFALATIQSGVLPQAVEGKASFTLDIDLARTHELAPDRDRLFSQLSAMQEPKNSFYRRLLTKKALEEFS